MGRGWGGVGGVGGEDFFIKTSFFVYCSLLAVFCTKSIIRKNKKDCSRTEQASNKTVAKKILEVPFCKSRQIYWICKNMAVEISLIYLLTESCSGACFFFFFLSHSFFLLFNRNRIGCIR